MTEAPRRYGQGLRLKPGDPRLSGWYSPRGGRAYARKYTYHVEGEYLTSRQIAERLGLSMSTIQGRLKSLREADQPLTWNNLKSKRSA